MEAVKEFLIEHSPPESGPIYLAIAEHWDLVQPALLAFLLILFLLSLSIATATWLQISDD